MIVSGDLRGRFNEAETLLQVLQQKVSGTLRGYCSSQGFLFDDRVKSLESLAEKLESGRFRSWSEVDDLYACTVIVPFRSKELAAYEFIRKAFQVTHERLRGSVSKPPDVFRFDSSRFTATLREPAGEAVTKLPFEVQVKTIYEFAWSRTTHALAYKSPSVDWRRLRLAAQLKAATEQLDAMVDGFEANIEYFGGGSTPEIEDMKVLYESLRSLSADGRIPPELLPKDWNRFVENLYSLLKAGIGKDPNWRSRDQLTQVADINASLTRYFTEIEPSKIPRSLSLLQLIAVVLVKDGVLKKSSDRYYAPVTSELESLYPEVKLPGPPFAWND